MTIIKSASASIDQYLITLNLCSTNIFVLSITSIEPGAEDNMDEDTGHVDNVSNTYIFDKLLSLSCTRCRKNNEELFVVKYVVFKSIPNNNSTPIETRFLCKSSAMDFYNFILVNIGMN